MVRSLTALVLMVAAALIAISAPALAAPDAKTTRMFRAKCATCHGADGKGDNEEGKKLGVADLTSAAVQKLSAAEIKKVIVEGKKAPGKTEGMDSFKDKLSDEQIDLLVGYVQSLK